MGWTSQDARQIEHAQARERSISARQGLRWRIADLQDLYSRHVRERLTLRVACPLFSRAGHSAAHTVGSQGILELLRVPTRHSGGDFLAIPRAAEHGQGAGGQVREIAVQ